mgnify:CR=1 FL=1
MRNLRDTFMRLLILADHLKAGKLFENYEKLHYFYSDDKKILLLGKGGLYHCIVPQAYYELPYLYSEFGRTAAGEVYYKESSGVHVNYAIMEFYGLNLQEYLHLFAVRRQNCERYGGSLVTVDYSVQQIATNIQEFLERVLEEEKLKKKKRSLAKKIRK